MTGRRAIGASLIAALVAMVALQVPALVSEQPRQPFDRRLSLRRETTIEALAARSRSDAVRFQVGFWYWLALELPDRVIYVTPATARRLLPLRSLGNIRVVEWDRPTPLALTRQRADELRVRVTHRFVVSRDGARVYLSRDARAMEYLFLTLDGAPYILLPRDQLASRRRRGRI